MKLVLDASMTLAWLFERENPDEARCADQALLALPNCEAQVPPLWHTEIANALLTGERRGGVTEAQTLDFLTRLGRLPIATEDTPPAERREGVMALAREHGLTAYDATYLELALRSTSVLGTFDKQLAGAMRRAGGRIFGDA